MTDEVKQYTVANLTNGDIWRVGSDKRILGKDATDWNLWVLFNGKMEPTTTAHTGERMASYLSGVNPIKQRMERVGNLKQVLPLSAFNHTETPFGQLVIERVAFEMAKVRADRYMHWLASAGLLSLGGRKDTDIQSAIGTGVVALVDTLAKGVAKELEDKAVPLDKRRYVMGKIQEATTALLDVDDEARALGLDVGDLWGDVGGAAQNLMLLAMYQLEYIDAKEELK